MILATEKVTPKTLVKADIPPLAMFYEIIILLVGLVLPMVLVPIIRLTGYSEVVEEVAMALVVIFLILKLPTHRTQIIGAIAFGFLFGLSENFLYLSQILQHGNINMFWLRFIFTVPMHMTTILVLVFSGMAGRWFLIFGLFGAITLHILFNTVVVNALVR